MAFENLKKSLNERNKKQKKEEVKEEKISKTSKEMEIGYHRGALNTLINERNELIKMARITERFMKGHLKRLEELGVKINYMN